MRSATGHCGRLHFFDYNVVTIGGKSELLKPYSGFIVKFIKKVLLLIRRITIPKIKDYDFEESN